MYCRFQAVLVVLACFLSTAPSCLADTRSYLLGPQDKLRIRVYDWRGGLGEAHEWTALNGEFVVGASGDVSLPLVGDLQAADLTTSALGHALARALQSKVGLANEPDASVEVLEYRPFYVLGYVEKAGEYAYRPDMTVLQAAGLAGGAPRQTDADLLGFERDALASHGEVRLLAAERLNLLVRQARLEAEIKGSALITFPPEVEARQSDPEVARAMKEEELLLASSRQSIEDRKQLLSQTRDILGHEIETLDAKDKSLEHQLSLTKQELDQVTALVSKGLAPMPRQLALQQTASQYEGSLLDVQLAKLRAQQEISRTSREIIELETKRRTDALTESADIRSRIAAASERIATAQTLIYQAETRAPEVTKALTKTNRLEPVYRVTRAENGVAVTKVVTENDAIQPGDILRVERRRSEQTVDAN